MRIVDGFTLQDGYTFMEAYSKNGYKLLDSGMIPYSFAMHNPEKNTIISYCEGDTHKEVCDFKEHYERRLQIQIDFFNTHN